MDCIFCKIVSGEIPSDKVYEDEKILAFRDLNPEGPEHVLVIPKEHIMSLATVNETHLELLGYIQVKISEIAGDLGIKESGFRVVANTGDEGGQTVHHLHYHVIGGRFMTWPPG
jgi:histidine triad (HIT) family protein